MQKKRFQHLQLLMLSAQANKNSLLVKPAAKTESPRTYISVLWRTLRLVPYILFVARSGWFADSYSGEQAKRRRTIIFFSFIFFIFLSAAQVAQAQENEKYGGQLVLSTTSDPKSFNDILAKEVSTSEVTEYLFEGLTRLNPFTLKVEPHLAESWEVDASGLKWIFHLRKDVRWFDGMPFTADVVVFTFNDLIYNPNIPSSSRDIFTIDEKPFKVEKIDDLTVAFTLHVRFAPFLRGMGQAILPKHKLKKAVDEGKFNFTWGIDTDPKEIVGTGAFKLVKYLPGQRLVFERNPYDWKKSAEGDRLPYLDRVVYMIVQSSDVELLKFLEGSVDYYQVRGMDFSLLKPEEKRLNFTMYDMGPAMGSNFLAFNLNDEVNPKDQKPYVDPKRLAWFMNKDFRRAISHVIDREKIIEIVKNGLGYPQHSPIGPGSGFFYNGNVPEHNYDLQEAKRILDEAGFKDRNNDEIVEDPQGNPVEFSLYTNADNSERLDISGIIRHDLEKLGLKINFQPVEFNTLVNKINATFDWDVMVMGLTGGIEPHFGKNVWHSTGQLHMWHPRQKTPATPWEKRIDELFSLGVQELNEDKRKIYYDEFQLIISQELPVIYTVLDAKYGALRNKFENIKPSTFGLFHNLEEIFVKKEFK